MTTRRQVLGIAWPIILSNLSTPLLGLVDTAVMGNLGDPALLGAIAVAGMIFSFIYWGFGFLRMGTTGLVAQARGAGQHDEVKAAFYRALLLALAIAAILLLLQAPLAMLAFALIDGSPAVESAAAAYFSIRILAAPFSLTYLVVLGYLLGQQKTGALLGVQLLLNGVNILLDLVFVPGLGWGIAGAAWATVIAEILAAGVGLFLAARHIRRRQGGLSAPPALTRDMRALKRTLLVNRDIMVRTLCLIFAFAWFTNASAGAGDVLLAANAILLQFVSFSAFFLDGYALAAESLVGAAVGGKNTRQYDLTMRYICELGFAAAVPLGIGFAVAGPFVIDLLTNVDSVREASRLFLPWAIAAPVVSLWCYLLDGVFIGATCTAEMRNAMLLSLVVFLLAGYLAFPLLGNNGLWLSLHLYFAARAVSLCCYLPRVRRLTAG